MRRDVAHLDAGIVLIHGGVDLVVEVVLTLCAIHWWVENCAWSLGGGESLGAALGELTCAEQCAGDEECRHR